MLPRRPEGLAPKIECDALPPVGPRGRGDLSNAPEVHLLLTELEVVEERAQYLAIPARLEVVTEEQRQGNATDDPLVAVDEGALEADDHLAPVQPQLPTE